MICRNAPEDLEDLFPGRWDQRRPIHDDVRELVGAVAGALAEAGWWVPGSGAEVEGGLVVATDLQASGPSDRFGEAVASGEPVSPTDFLFALPSSAAAVIGLTLGLLDYQATICGTVGAGAQAYRHGMELIAAGELERVVVAGLTLSGDFRMAVAYCIDPQRQSPVMEPLIAPEWRGFAAPSLLDAPRDVGYQ